MHTKTSSLLIALSLLALIGSTSEAQSTRRQVLRVDPYNKIDAYAFDCYVNGLLFEQLGEPYGAIDNFKNAQRVLPGSFEIGYSLAELYFSLRDPSLALKELDKLQDRDTRFYRLQGACYQSLGETDKAVGAFLKITEVDSTDESAYSFLANVYRQRQNVDSTLWAYENLARVSPDNFRIWNELGRLRAQKGQVEKAKDAFKSSIELNKGSNNLIALAGLGELYVMTKQPDSGIVVLREALAIDTANVLINRQLMGIYIDRDSLTLALPFARKVVNLDPTDRTNVRRLGWLYFNLDSLNQADSIFTELVGKGEDTGFSRYFLGQVALAKHDYPRAKDQFAGLLQADSSAAGRWIDLGYTYRMMGFPDTEVVLYKTGIQHVKSDSGQVRLLFALGAAQERTGHLDSAMATLETVVARSPKDPQALNYFGYLLADKNMRLDYARELIEKAVKAEPKNGAYLDSYGWVYFRLGKLNKALDYLKQAAALTKDATIYDHLGDVYKAKGKMVEAREWWRKALDLDTTNAAIKGKMSE